MTTDIANVAYNQAMHLAILHFKGFIVCIIV